jgi:hypothetical protein
MAVSLGKYCAYWFVQHRLGHSNDTEPPVDGLLAVINRRELARRIVRSVRAAALTTGTHHVDLDPETFVYGSDDWQTLFDVVDSMWGCARQIDAARANPKAHATAFADYMATRWVYRRVLNEEITARPTDDEVFPPSYDSDGKRGLAETLASRCVHIGIELKDKSSFVGAASKWRLLSHPRAALLRQVMLMLAMAMCVQPAEAQLADAGGTSDEAISVFFQKAKGDAWRGGVATHGEQALKSESVRANWQLDYGSVGGRRETPSGVTPGKELAVSKNSGIYTLSYVRNYSERWRLKGDAGVEHQRTATADLGTDNRVNVIANASVRTIGAKTLWRGNLAPQGSWLFQANMATSKALTLHREVRTVFFDPVSVGWLSFLPGYITAPDQTRILFRRIQFRAELAWMRPFNADINAAAHWDASAVFFFTPGNGMMLRRFSGFFDHNLRDRKDATTFSLLWKFR